MAEEFVACFEASNHEIWMQNFISIEHIGTSFMLTDPLTKGMVPKNKIDDLCLHFELDYVSLYKREEMKVLGGIKSCENYVRSCFALLGHASIMHDLAPFLHNHASHCKKIDMLTQKPSITMLLDAQSCFLIHGHVPYLAYCHGAICDGGVLNWSPI
ncbi:hypothetical protein CR513_04428, partial [Mucuna pruriens]